MLVNLAKCYKLMSKQFLFFKCPNATNNILGCYDISAKLLLDKSSLTTLYSMSICYFLKKDAIFIALSFTEES